MRLGPGPVFVYEWLTTARRWQLYAMRALFVTAILVVLAFTWSQMNRYREVPERASLEELARYGEAIYFAIVLVELTLVLLAAPAATAGAVCLDKARGTLDHMLATDLSNAEIVLGKLGVRLIPVLGLIACTLPVVALTSLLGGIIPLALAGSFLVAIGCALVGCSLAMTLSVWARKSHEVVIMTYMLLLLWLCFPGLAAIAMYFLGVSGPAAVSIWPLIAWTNPYYLLFAPYTDQASVDLWTFVAFLGACLAFSGGLAGLATVRIRRVALRQAGRPAAGPRRRWLPRRPSWLPGLPGPSMDLNPVAWREWHRMRPSWMMRIAWGLYAAVGVLWFVLSLRESWSTNMLAQEIALMSAFQVALGLLLLSVGASTSLAEERARGSLDILLSTPMSTRSILAGKWWGTFRQIGPVVFWPALLSAGLLFHFGNGFHYLLLIGVILAYGAVITSLGLALATWVSRAGRAIAICVTAYVVFSIVWPFVISLIAWANPGVPGLLMGCPAIGTFFATALVGPDHFGPRERSGEFIAPLTIWMMFDLALAAALFARTCATFDSHLGRMPETSRRPPSGGPERTPPAPDEWLDPAPSFPKDKPDGEQVPAPHHPP